MNTFPNKRRKQGYLIVPRPNESNYFLAETGKEVKRRRQNVVPVVSPGEATLAAFANRDIRPVAFAARSPLPKGREEEISLTKRSSK